MAINPNIALSFQAPKFEDPLNKLAQMEQIKAYRQNALAKQMEMDTAVREREMTNALRQRLASGKELGLSEAAMFGDPGMKMYQSMTAAQAQEQARQTSRAKFLNEKIKQFSGMLAGVKTPDQYQEVRNMATQEVPEFDKTWVTADQWTPEWNSQTVAGASAITKQLEMSYRRPFEIEKEINSLTGKLYTDLGVKNPEVETRIFELRDMLSEMTGVKPRGSLGAPPAALAVPAAAATALERPIDEATQPMPPPPSLVSAASRAPSFREQVIESKGEAEGARKEAARKVDVEKEKPSAIASAQRAMQSLNEITTNLDALLGEKTKDAKADDPASYAGHPGLEFVTGKIAGRPFAREFTRSLSDEAADAAAIQDAIDAQKFVSSIAELKALSSSGSTGLGQLAVQEGNKIQTAFADLNAARGTEAYKKKLLQFKTKIDESKKLIAEKVNSVYGKGTISFGGKPISQPEVSSLESVENDGWSITEVGAKK